MTKRKTFLSVLLNFFDYCPYNWNLNISAFNAPEIVITTSAALFVFVGGNFPVFDGPAFYDFSTVGNVRTVSYTHLTLPTNREV